jgi:hypothetical protein
VDSDSTTRLHFKALNILSGCYFGYTRTLTKKRVGSQDVGRAPTRYSDGTRAPFADDFWRQNDYRISRNRFEITCWRRRHNSALKARMDRGHTQVRRRKSCCIDRDVKIDIDIVCRSSRDRFIAYARSQRAPSIALSRVRAGGRRSRVPRRNDANEGRARYDRSSATRASTRDGKGDPKSKRRVGARRIFSLGCQFIASLGEHNTFGLRGVILRATTLADSRKTRDVSYLFGIVL